MKIEVNERGSKAFYKETVNVASQARKLAEKPEAKLKDYFRVYMTDLILCLVFLALLVITGFAWGFKTLDFVCMALLAVVSLMCAAYLAGLNKARKSLMNDWTRSVLTLDEEGIELAKEGGATVRMAWGSIAVIRAFKEGLGFVSAEGSGLTITVANQYKDQVLAWLKENDTGVRLIA